MRRRDLLFAAIALLFLWQIASVVVNEPILPGPLVVAQAFIKDMGRGLGAHFLVSMLRHTGGGAGSPGRHNSRTEQEVESIHFAGNLHDLPRPESRTRSRHSAIVRHWRLS